MPEAPDDIEKLLSDVRKTITDNKLFLEKLVDEAIEVDTDEDSEPTADGDDFEEL